MAGSFLELLDTIETARAGLSRLSKASTRPRHAFLCAIAKNGGAPRCFFHRNYTATPDQAPEKQENKHLMKTEKSVLHFLTQAAIRRIVMKVPRGSRNSKPPRSSEPSSGDPFS